MRTTRTRTLTAALAAAFIVAACDDSPTDPPVDPVATEVEVSPADANLTFIGASAQLEATVRDQQGDPITGAEVTWSTSNPSVASVSATGEVEAVGNGTATITASSGDVSGSADITVEQEPNAIEADTSEVLLAAVGQTSQVEVTVEDEGGTPIEGAEISWTSSDQAVATVDSDGVIEAVGAGTAIITATSGDLTVEIEVVVQPAAAITIEPSELALASIGASGELTAVVTDATGGQIPGLLLSWSSSNESVATVDGNGVVEAVANGDATITAQVVGIAGLSATVDVTVEQQAAAVSVSPGEATLTTAGATIELTAVVSDAEGNEMEGAAIVWTTSNAAVATVDESGVVQAVANGVVTITATSGDASAEAEITVDIDD
jgi:trimeric autotransporter adhesin